MYIIYIYLFIIYIRQEAAIRRAIQLEHFFGRSDLLLHFWVTTPANPYIIANHQEIDNNTADNEKTFATIDAPNVGYISCQN